MARLKLYCELSCDLSQSAAVSTQTIGQSLPLSLSPEMSSTPLLLYFSTPAEEELGLGGGEVVLDISGH